MKPGVELFGIGGKEIMGDERLLGLELWGIGGKRWIHLFYHQKPKKYRWEKGERDRWEPGA